MRLFLFILLMLCIVHAHEAAPDQVQYKGRILSVQEYRFIDRPAAYLQFLMKTQKGEQIIVEVGPVWYLNREGLKFYPQERIEVTGSKLTVNGEDILVASRLFKNNERWLLRNPDGTPTWAKTGSLDESQ